MSLGVATRCRKPKSGCVLADRSGETAQLLTSQNQSKPKCFLSRSEHTKGATNKVLLLRTRRNETSKARAGTTGLKSGVTDTRGAFPKTLSRVRNYLHRHVEIQKKGGKMLFLRSREWAHSSRTQREPRACFPATRASCPAHGGAQCGPARLCRRPDARPETFLRCADRLAFLFF